MQPSQIFSKVKVSELSHSIQWDSLKVTMHSGLTAYKSRIKIKHIHNIKMLAQYQLELKEQFLQDHNSDLPAQTKLVQQDIDVINSKAAKEFFF